MPIVMTHLNIFYRERALDLHMNCNSYAHRAWCFLALFLSRAHALITMAMKYSENVFIITEKSEKSTQTHTNINYAYILTYIYICTVHTYYILANANIELNYVLLL